MAYTTNDAVTDLIGAAYTSTDLPDADVTAHVLSAGSVIDSACAARYYPFNAIASTKTDGTTIYTTPKLVELACRHLAVSICMRQLRVQAINTVLKDSADFHWTQGIGIVQQLVDPTFALPPAVYLNELLVYGTADEAWLLRTNEAFLAVTSPMDSGDPPHIVLDSVRIGSGTTTIYGDATAAEIKDMRNGVDFWVRWDAGYQRYIFTANAPELWQGAPAPKITWEWTYDRDRGAVVSSGANLSGVFYGQ